MQTEITQLGHWVKLLAKCCQDPVDNICSLSSQAAYNLNCILSRKRRMGNLLLSHPLQPTTWAGHPPTVCPGRVRPKKLIEHLISIYESTSTVNLLGQITQTGNSCFEFVSPPPAEPHTFTQFYFCSETGSLGIL